jgi:hypothetical protein
MIPYQNSKTYGQEYKIKEYSGRQPHSNLIFFENDSKTMTKLKYHSTSSLVASLFSFT